MDYRSEYRVGGGGGVVYFYFITLHLFIFINWTTPLNSILVGYLLLTLLYMFYMLHFLFLFLKGLQFLMMTLRDYLQVLDVQ